MKKTVFRFADQVRHKPGCTDMDRSNRKGINRNWCNQKASPALEIPDLGSSGIALSTKEKTKALISCTFVFAYEKTGFS